MDPATYEQEAIDLNAFGDQHDFLIENMEVTLSFHEGEIISGRQLQQVLLQSYHLSQRIYLPMGHSMKKTKCRAPCV